MPKIFFISGLAADSRAFTKIKEFEGYQKVFLEWIPNLPNEVFCEYVSRLIENQTFTEDDVAIGLSFGGLAAIEIAKHTPLNKVILISSFKDKKALKPHLKFLLELRLYNLMPNKKSKLFDKHFVKVFGNVSEEAKQGLIDMMNDTKQSFIKWALKQIRLSNYVDTTAFDLYNIIGTNDQLLKPWSLPNNNFLVEKGGHLIVYENADEVNSILETLL